MKRWSFFRESSSAFFIINLRYASSCIFSYYRRWIDEWVCKTNLEWKIDDSEKILLSRTSRYCIFTVVSSSSFILKFIVMSCFNHWISFSWTFNDILFIWSNHWFSFLKLKCSCIDVKRSSFKNLFTFFLMHAFSWNYKVKA